MIIYVILATIIAICLLGIVYVVVRKLNNIANINVSTLPQEKATIVKNRILTERLARQFSDTKKTAIRVLSPLAEKARQSWTVFYYKTIEMEKENIKKLQPLKTIDINQEIKEKLIQAEQLFAERELEKAEDVCVSVVELDPVNIDVYELLTDIYIENREYKKARETCRFGLKLLTKGSGGKKENVDKHRLANCYSELGWIYQLEGKPTYALANFQKAVDLEPENPRFLDLLLKISIILKDKALALSVFNKMQIADPDNQKLPEIKEEIEELPGN
jgi:tetratricopeptide (TPR) repeat protein